MFIVRGLGLLNIQTPPTPLSTFDQPEGKVPLLKFSEKIAPLVFLGLFCFTVLPSAEYFLVGLALTLLAARAVCKLSAFGICVTFAFCAFRPNKVINTNKIVSVNFLIF